MKIYRVLPILVFLFNPTQCLLTPSFRFISSTVLPIHLRDNEPLLHYDGNILIDRSSSSPGREYDTSLHMKRGSKSKSLSTDSFNKYLRSPTIVIMFANIAIFLASQIFPGITNVLMKNDRLITRGQTYRLFSACFAHGSFYHIGTNLYSLYNLGPQGEEIFGPTRFLAIYLMSGLLGNIGTYFAGTSPYSVGASGCIFGMIGAFGMFYFRNKKVLGERSQVALQSIMRTIGLNLFYGASVRGIDGAGHFGGLIAGALLSYLIGPRLIVKSVANTGASTRYSSVKIVDRPLINYIPFWKRFKRTLNGSNDSNSNSNNESLSSD